MRRLTSWDVCFIAIISFCILGQIRFSENAIIDKIEELPQMEVNQMELTSVFYNCETKQQVIDRLAKMEFQEIRQVMTAYGCSIEEIERVVCRQLQITK